MLAAVALLCPRRHSSAKQGCKPEANQHMNWTKEWELRRNAPPNIKSGKRRQSRRYNLVLSSRGSLVSKLPLVELDQRASKSMVAARFATP